MKPSYKVRSFCAWQALVQPIFFVGSLISGCSNGYRNPLCIGADSTL
jgi:hypothetical protein